MKDQLGAELEFSGILPPGDLLPRRRGCREEDGDQGNENFPDEIDACAAFLSERQA